MDKKEWKGFALILFGILLCVSRYGFIDTMLEWIPLEIFGLCCGGVGIAWIFDINIKWEDE